MIRLTVCTDSPDISSMSVASIAGVAPNVRLRRPTLLWSYALLAPAMIFILTSVDRSYQTDLWHHLARGREMCEVGSLVDHDVFTYTLPGQPIVDNNWATQVIAYKLYEWGGLNLVQAANSTLLAMTIALVLRIGLRRGAPARGAAVICVVLVAGLSQSLLIRPQTVSMFLFVALFTVMVGSERRPKRLVLAPLIMAAWANLHGAFPIGLVLIGCFTLAGCIDACRRLECANAKGIVACFVVSSIATLANPYGIGVYEYVFTTSSRATGRVIQEWLRPDLFSLAGVIWIASFGLMILLASQGRRPVRIWAAVVAAVFALISCTSVRMGIWWYLAAASVAMTIWPRHKPQKVGRSAPAVGMYAMILAAMILCLPAMEPWNPVFAMRSPARPEQNLTELANDIATAAPGGRVFSRLEWGEYLSFALPWKESIFMDGRIEIYPDRLWNEYRQITSVEPNWQALLDRHSVTVLLLDRHYHDGLILAASQSREWQQLTTAGTGVIFVRRSAKVWM